MLVWLKSDAIIEWGSLLGLSKLLKVNEFYSMKREENSLMIDYPHFLDIKYHNFITKMLSCPLCLSVWLSIILCSIISITLLDFYILVLIPTVCILSLITYGIINGLIKFST
jgi:hypothetical protein